MIKKVFFLLAILFLFNGLVINAQKNTTLKRNLELLQNKSKHHFLKDNSGLSEIKKSKFYTKSNEPYLFELDSNNIHFIDFNKDGLKDIIYQNTEHYHATILFANKGGDFVEIWNGAGSLIEVKKEIETNIYILSYFIGCNSNTTLTELTVNSENSINENSISYHYNTEVKDIKETLKQKKVSGILRTQAIVNNKEKIDPCSGEKIIGNQLKTIKNKVVTILIEKENWLLVLFQDKNNSIICWIQKNLNDK